MSQPLLSEDEHAAALAAQLPSGRAWMPKLRRGSNLYSLLRGLAPTFREMDRYLERFVDQQYPPETVDYLDEWEEALGLPDDCLPDAVDTATRQRNILIKLVLIAGVQTEQDFVDLAALFGLTITVNSGIEHVSVAQGGYELYGPALTIPGDFADVDEARMTMVVVETLPAAVTFPWEFPLLFSSNAQTSLRCLIEKLKPANVNLVFVEAP